MKAPLQNAAISFFSLSLLAATCITGWQGFVWLRDGFWPPLSVLDAYAMLAHPAMDSWVWAPSTWLGLHKALLWLPTSLALLAVAFVVVFFTAD